MELSREVIRRIVGGNGGSVVIGSGGGEGGGEGGGGGTSIVDWANITSKPTTISGYGITDAYISGGAIYLGGNSITPLVSGDLNGYATQQWVGQQGFLTSSDISDMATQTWVGQQGFLTSRDLSGYATQQWVGQQGFATTSQLSHYLALTGGTMEDSIITPGSDSYGIYPETDRYGFIGKSTNWYWNIYGSRLYAEKMELYVYSSGSRSLYGGIDNNNFYLYPGTNSYKFNVDSNGYVTAQKFVKDGGTSSQFLKANGDVDSSVYLTGVTLNSNALTVTNNTVNIPIAGANTPGVVQIGTGLTTNQDHLEVDTTVIATQAWVNSQSFVTESAFSGMLEDEVYISNGTIYIGSNSITPLLAGYDNDIITHDNEFNFVSAGFGGDVIQFPDGDDVWFNYRTASGNLDGNISSYKFGDGKGGVLAVISNGQFSGNAASATKALKVVQGNNDRLVTNANGVTAVGDNNNSTIGFRTDGSAHYEPYIMIRKTLDGNNSAEFHLDYYTANGGHYFKDATSGYADVYAKSFVIHDTSYPTVSVSMSADFASGYVNFTSGMRGYIFDAPVTQSSDARLKSIVSHAVFEVDKLATLPLVWFTWKKDERRRMHFGSIAQEWQKVLPEVVSENGDGILAMDYGAAAMAAGVTACREIVKLKAEIERLKEMINNK